MFSYFEVSLVFMLVILVTSCSIRLRSSRTPVVLYMKSYKPGGMKGTTTNQTLAYSSNIRTKPWMFQKILGLVPGRTFEFQLDRWIALKECGLYRNLTAHTVLKDNEVQLEVSGIEMPCITFAPEISVGASASNPNIAGGVLYRNKNFRGIGEQIEITIAKKETFEIASHDMQDLGISSTFRWRDCGIGRSSNIELKYEKDTIIDTFGNFIAKSSKQFDKVVMGMSKFCAVFKSAGVSSGNANLKHFFSVEPYVAQFDQAPGVSFIMSGAKTRYDIENMQRDFTGSCWLDCGRNLYHHGNTQDETANFAVFGSRLSSPSIPLLMPVSSNSSGNCQSAMLKMKFRGLFSKAVGSDLIPYFHLQSLSNPNVVRCAHIKKDNVQNTITTSFSAKADFYLRPIAGMVRGGVFTDVCVFKRQSHQDLNVVATYGVSARLHGIRVDIGLPVWSSHKPRLHIGLDQGE